MSYRNPVGREAGFRGLGLLATAVVMMCCIGEVVGGDFRRSSAVGGVTIDAQGILSAPRVEDQRALQAERQKALDAIPGDLQQFTPLRKISLRRLEEAIRNHRTTQVVPLPDEIQFLGGLQEIKYVFVYPEENDIVLVGPAEGWKVDELGNLVGLTTNRPVMELEDLLVALRSARHGAMSCSIDPTTEGLKNMQQLVSQLKTIGNPQQTMARIEQALGPQTITVNGVPASSHFARVMVAADFRMKRIAMHFEEAPVAGLPSFLQMMQAGTAGMKNMLPRWWLEPTADPLLTDAEGLSWEIRNFRVECMTEEDYVAKDGTRQQGVGKGSPVARRWAELFTNKYDELSTKDSVFGQLRNVMQLAVVGALIHRENLFDRVDLQVPYLMGEEMVEAYDVPRQVASRASFIKKGRNWIISASGGVQLIPSEMVAKSEKSETLAPVRAQAAAKSTNWWWN